MDAPAPGWYPDQQIPGALRWWDGTGWTAHVAAPEGAPPPWPLASTAVPQEPMPTLPLPAALGALVALAVPLLVSQPLLRATLGWDLPVAVYLVMLGVLTYGPSVWWWRVASRRYGSGRPFADVGLRFVRGDVGYGPLTWLVCLAGQIIAAAIVLGLRIPFEGNTESIRENRDVMAFAVPMVVLAVVVAPFVEEIVFRGLVLRGLASRMTPWLAVVVQGALFGAAHIDGPRGIGNIGLVLVLGTLGAALGAAALRLGRIAPSIIAHTIVNTIAMTVALSGWEPPSQ